MNLDLTVVGLVLIIVLLMWAILCMLHYAGMSRGGK